MNRSPLLCACVAVALLACSERVPKPAAGSEATAAPAQPPAPPEATPRATPEPAAAARDAGVQAAGPSTPDAGSGKCSAATLSPEATAARPVLPAPVESMRRRIVAAAVACDYAALKALGSEKGKGLSFTFGVAEDPAVYWREAEEQGEPVLARIVRVLNLPYAKDEGVFVWPAVHVTGPKSEADWKSLEGLYPEEQLRSMREADVGYLGLRVGISAKGDWQYAIAGD
ncbi:MAG TPA: hypothetical protein VE153_18610 [Myxococcus sp.]|nr:hypothetical protein [Myxococcus sp.]